MGYYPRQAHRRGAPRVDAKIADERKERRKKEKRKTIKYTYKVLQ
jgi:hypothetical protein